MSTILTLIHSGAVHCHTGVGLKSGNGTVDFVTPGTEEFSVEISMLVNIWSTNKWSKDDTGRRIYSKDCRHEFITNNSEVLVDHCKTLDIKISSSQHTETLVCIPRRIRNIIGNLNICTVLPTNVSIRIVDKCSAKILSFCVCFKGSLSVPVGERLLDLHVHNVKSIIGTVGGGTVSIVRQTKELSANFLAIGIEWFNVTESNTRNIVPGSTTVTINVGSTSYSVKNVGNGIVGII
mmetsp:Transcript_17341/g.32849  ORF Transcript_17341/g.32849 Transcript_17341/m.32849 type:complete len:236 (-) Transcript_17341:1892-2599(-)